MPRLADVVFERIEELGGSVRAHPQAAQASCPECSGESARVHSRYERRLTDAAAGGRCVEIALGVRRFFCDDTDCASAGSAGPHQIGVDGWDRVRHQPYRFEIQRRHGSVVADEDRIRLRLFLSVRPPMG